ncbi:MAG TPA: nuclear transport factor 2 family protein [Gemmatimonadales bacterium]|nr:nuclear transport factor 2 family protein [Gemmatimonadales bacterium]
MDQLTATRHAERIRELEQSWMDAVARRDLGAMMAIYAPEAQELIPGQPGIVGREAIRAFYDSVLEAFPRLRHSFDLQEITISEAGDLAVVRGTYRFTPDADIPDEIEIGKFVGVWIYSEGDWRLQINISNPDEAE